VPVARVFDPLAYRMLLDRLGKIPEMATRRIHGAQIRKRFTRVAAETALVVTLLLPWAAILAWLFWRGALR
jgi:hypothetical protein